MAERTFPTIMQLDDWQARNCEVCAKGFLYTYRCKTHRDLDLAGVKARGYGDVPVIVSKTILARVCEERCKGFREEKEAQDGE